MCPSLISKTVFKEIDPAFKELLGGIIFLHVIQMKQNLLTTSAQSRQNAENIKKSKVMDNKLCHKIVGLKTKSLWILCPRAAWLTLDRGDGSSPNSFLVSVL